MIATLNVLVVGVNLSSLLTKKQDKKTMQNIDKEQNTNNHQPDELPIGAVRRSFWCRIGLHDWYHGNFSSPVWGRYERHCLECYKKQYAKYENKKRKWVDF